MFRPVTPLNLALVAALLAITVAGFLVIPADRQLAVHWGLSGAVDSTMPRNLALLQMPVATAAIWAVFAAIARWGNPERRRGGAVALRWAVPVVTALLALAQLVIVLVGAGVPVAFFQPA